MDALAQQMVASKTLNKPVVQFAKHNMEKTNVKWVLKEMLERQAKNKPLVQQNDDGGILASPTRLPTDSDFTSKRNRATNIVITVRQAATPKANHRHCEKCLNHARNWTKTERLTNHGMDQMMQDFPGGPTQKTHQKAVVMDDEKI